MADWLQSLILGIIQGLTEFLPVSSSGHLVLFQAWLGDTFFASGDEVFFDLVLHVGTLLPVLWFYRADVAAIARSPMAGPGLKEAGGLMAWLRAEPSRWVAAMVVVATIPTGLIGVLLEEQFEHLFSTVTPVCIALLCTGALLLSTRWIPERTDGTVALTLRTALLIGLAQGLAITPGISRSGSTIAIALFLGFDRDLAARFSFLASIPAILGAVVLKSRDGFSVADGDWFAVGVGFVAAFVVGYGALVMLVAIVKRGGLHRFTWYLWPAAIGAWVLLA